MKKYLFSLLSLVLGMGFWIAYTIIGSKIAPDGTLIESFYLIPMGYLFLALGLVSLLLVFSVSVIRKRKS